MAFKLEPQHKHILKLTSRDAGADGWASVSDNLFHVLSQNMPTELVTFEKLEFGGRARLTEEGKQILSAMEWF